MGGNPTAPNELENAPTQALPRDADTSVDDPALLATFEGDPAAAAVPKWLGDRYRVKGVLGRGGMGAVYLAVDEALACEVALKQVNRPGDALARLRDEVRLAQKVTHPNVCRTYDLEEIDGNWLVKMEYIAGDTLAERLKHGPLPVATAIAIAARVCVGLAAAHRVGVVHRDLKPSNIMIEEGTGRVVLMDFGIARTTALAGTTAEGVSGTPAYMAPEQVRGREVDGRADLYALGCVIYEMLTGERVFPRATPMAAALAHTIDAPPALPARVPPRLRRLIARLLEKDPARRPNNAAEVAAALDGPPQRRRFQALLALVAAVLGGGGWLVWRVARTRPEWRPVVHELGPEYRGQSRAPVFSPDGKLIAYASNRSGSANIYVYSVTDESTRMIGPRDLMLWLPRWTRDGRGILADWSNGRCTAGIRLSIDSPSTELVVKDGCMPDDCGDGRLLFVQEDSPDCQGCPRIVLREADGREREVIRRPPQYWIDSPHCDPAGENVVFGAAEGGIWVVSLAGRTPRKVFADGSRASFHPDGKNLVISSPRSGYQSLWEVPLDGRPPSQITFGIAADLEADFSPDGRMIVFAQVKSPYTTPLFAHSLRDGAWHRLTGKAEALDQLLVTPDGKHVIARADRPHGRYIVTISTDNGEERDLVKGDTPALSPDGAEVVYSVLGTTTAIFAVPTTGGRPRRVTEVARPVVGLAVGPESSLHLSIAGENGFEAWRAPLAGGVAEREAPSPWFRIIPAPVGGWRAALRIQKGLKEVHLLAPAMDLDEPSARVIGGDVEDVAWDHDGASVVYAQHGNVHRLWVTTNEDVVLFGLDSFFHGGPAASPDGGTIYITQSVEGWQSDLKLITNFGDRPRMQTVRGSGG